MSLERTERELLARLADVLIPAGEGFPSASEAGVAEEGVDQVLSVRPDLLPALREVLARIEAASPKEFVAELQRADAAAFGVLAEIVPGAYFLNPDVRGRLGYTGQSERPFEPREDYLEDGLLQSVLDRGPIYRPTPGQRARAQRVISGYDWVRSYNWNYRHVPEPLNLPEPPVGGDWDFCGLKAASPLGIAAGPLLNGRWILYYASLGFDVLTYKTVRSRERVCYALPNLLPVGGDGLEISGETLRSSGEMEGSWAVSFGMPSRSPDVWRADIRRTREHLPPNKVLSVSVVATPGPEWTLTDVAEDFALCAKWAIQSGADCVEANFSCPNVASADGQLYQQPAAAGIVAAKLREATGTKPLLIKVGHITDAALATALVRAVAAHADGLVMVNCIGAKVVDGAGKPFFQGQARGIAGKAIYRAALEQIRLFKRIVAEEGVSMRLVGVGGIATAEQVRAHLEAGSHAVQLATAAMLDPGVGHKLRSGL